MVISPRVLSHCWFSSSAFSQLVLCSLRRSERFRPFSPIYTKPHSHGMRYTPGFWNSLTLSLCVQRDRNNLFSLEWYNWMPASFKILSILCEAEPIYGRLTEDWYSVFSRTCCRVFIALSMNFFGQPFVFKTLLKCSNSPSMLSTSQIVFVRHSLTERKQFVRWTTLKESEGDTKFFVHCTFSSCVYL